MTHEDAFLQDVLANPDDDTPRLIFADWLDDHGEPERAEFIRIQVRLARWEVDTQAQADELRARVRALLAEHDEEWAGPVVGGLANGWVFHRGFIEELTIEAGTLHDYAADLFAAAPLRRLRLLEARDHLADLVANPLLLRLEALDLTHNHIGDSGAAVLALARFLAPLSDLGLRANGIGLEGVQALTGSRYLRNLRRLDLSYNALGEPGGDVLASWPALERLSLLDVTGVDCCHAKFALRRRLGKRVRG
jgi:uncharacterized protein (TIGR02996 family)